MIWHVERPHVVEQNSPPCDCLLIVRKPLNRRLLVLLVNSVSVHEHEHEDILPSLGKGNMTLRVWTKLPNPVAFRDDPKWEAWTGIKDVHGTSCHSAEQRGRHSNDALLGTLISQAITSQRISGGGDRCHPGALAASSRLSMSALSEVLLFIMQSRGARATMFSCLSSTE